MRCKQLTVLFILPELYAFPGMEISIRYNAGAKIPGVYILFQGSINISCQ